MIRNSIVKKQKCQIFFAFFSCFSTGTFNTINDDERVTGYFTINTAQISACSIPIDIQKKLPRYPIPAFRIAKLAVDQSFQGSGVGRWLLTQALYKAIDVSNQVGVYSVLVDAIDEKAKGFYLKYGLFHF